MKNIKKIFFYIMLLLTFSTALAENKLAVGIGTGISNSLYRGVESKAFFLPAFDLDYENFYVKGLTVGYRLFKNENVTTSVFINPIAGFKLDASKMSAGYENVDDRDLQTMIGARLDIKTNYYDIRTGVNAQAGENGGNLKLSAYKIYYASHKFIILPSINITGYSGEFADYYFGVDSIEALKNSKLDEEYKANAAFSFGMNLSSEYFFNEKISLTSFLGIENFSSEIKDSPIVDNHIFYFGGIGLKYKF